MNKKRNIVFKVFALSLFLVCFISSYAQSRAFLLEKSLKSDVVYSVQKWNTENGLPQNSVNSIAQTTDGYMWFATFDGLVRFDGITFTVFNTSNTPALASNYISEIFADSENRLWVITSENMVLYENSVFTTFKVKPYLRGILFAENEATKQIAIYTQQGGLYTYKEKSLLLKDSLAGLTVNGITFKDNDLFLAAKTGLFKYDSKLTKVLTTEKEITSVKYILDSDEFVLTIDEGVYHLKNETLTVNKEFTVTDKIKSYHDIEKDLAVISTENQVYIAKEGNLIHCNESNGLLANKILKVYCDFQKNIWIGTNTNGVYFLTEKTFKSIAKEKGFNELSTSSIVQDLDSAIWVGFQTEGVYKITKEGELIERIKIGENNNVRSLMRDDEGNIWVGSGGRGVFCFKRDGKQLKYVNQSIYGKEVFSLLQDSEGRILAGTTDGIFQITDGKIKEYKTEIKYNHVSYLLEDSKKRIWYGSYDGVGIWDGDKHIKIDEKSGLSNNKVREIYEDKDGVFWIGTYGGGLNRYENGKIYHFENVEGLLDENISCIIEDDYGYFWMSSNKGLYRVEKKSLNDFAAGKTKMIKSRVYVKEDGISNIEFNGGFQPAAWKDFDDNFWFPSISGVVKGQPKNPELSKKTNVIIEKIVVDGNTLNQTENIEIRSSADEVEFYFTQPSFTSPQNIRFQFKIEGLHSDWINAGTRRVAYFSNIPGGEYIFKVRTYDNPEKEATFLFSVPIPLWKKWQFIVVVILLLTILIVLFMVARINTIKKKAIVKTQQNKKYAEMELAALRAQMNPHFIFNCLNTIKFFVATNDEDSANKYLNNFSKLMRMFLEHSKSNMITLSEEIELLNLYVGLENLRFDNHFVFELNVGENINAGAIEVPAMLFQPFVENAINHGLLNLKRKGSLRIAFYIKNNKLYGEIDDDGIGRDAAMELKLKSKKSHISRGLEITNERIEVLNSIKKAAIDIKTIDKFDEDGCSEGTRVIITIPI